MGKEFAFGRICPPYPFQKIHDGLLLFLPRYHGLCDVLVVSVQADTLLFFFRLHPVGHPFISIVITAGIVLLKYVSTFSVQYFSQMF